MLKIKGYEIRPDPAMIGAREGMAHDDEKVIWLSPAMYSLLDSDFELVVKHLRVRRASYSMML